MEPDTKYQRTKFSIVVLGEHYKHSSPSKPTLEVRGRILLENVKRHQLHHLKFICRQNNWIFSEVVRYGIMLALKEIKKDLSDRCPLT